ncbi:MAG: HDIG domain-containing protein [Desulfobacterales bacterium]|nr:HDIG domain-containing protein [Desulfobacterales bacterium]
MKKKKERKKSLKNFFESSSFIRWNIFIGLMVIFTTILYPNLIATRRSYNLGDVAERDIKAQRDFYVEDEEATQAERLKAEGKVLTVYDRDMTMGAKLGRQVNQAFEDIRKIIEEDKQGKPNADNENITAPADSSKDKKSLHERIRQMKGGFEKKIGITVSDEAFKLLEKDEFSKPVSYLIIKIVTTIQKNGVVANKEILLKEADKGIVLRDLKTKTERVVHSLKKIYGPEQYKEMVRIIAQPLVKDISKSLVPVIVDFSQRLIQPDITLNRSATEERKKRAVLEINPIAYQIKAGEMILREGERVTDIQLLKLDASNAQKKSEKILKKSIGAIMIIMYVIIITYFLNLCRLNGTVSNHNKDLLFIASILIIFSFLPKISSVLLESLSQYTPFPISASSMSLGIPLASSAMTICLFLGLDIAIPFAMVVAICTAMIFQNQFEIFVYFLLNGSMGAFWMRDCKERKAFIRAGAKLGLLNVVLATALYVYMGEFSGIKLLEDWAFAFMGGIGSGLVTSGLAPLVEVAFGYTTDITLLELGNLEQPILHKLMLEAPGTYHHSVIVGSMVEAAASEIGANPLLAKVCGYYHDIGKVKKPLYFIENQTNGKNRHDKLAPSMSSLILISHVKEGVEIAKKNKLGQSIIDAISQHHGTSLISFFYEKAKQLRGVDAVKIEDFCYPGPRPQTKEAGLVMLADVVEAASRTLDNPTPSRIQGLVQKLINKIFSDGQLDNCELTLRDLHKIAKSFNKILNGIHHHRIEYPENGKEKKEAKEKNGHSDQQQAKQSKDTSGKNTESSGGHLKRLGVS